MALEFCVFLPVYPLCLALRASLRDLVVLFFLVHLGRQVYPAYLELHLDLVHLMHLSLPEGLAALENPSYLAGQGFPHH